MKLMFVTGLLFCMMPSQAWAVYYCPAYGNDLMSVTLGAPEEDEAKVVTTAGTEVCGVDSGNQDPAWTSETLWCGDKTETLRYSADHRSAVFRGMTMYATCPDNTPMDIEMGN